MNCPADTAPAPSRPKPAATGTDTGAAKAARPAAAGATIDGSDPPRVSRNFKNGASVQPFSVGVKRACAAATRSFWYFSASASSIRPSLPAVSAASPLRRSRPAAAAALPPVVSSLGPDSFRPPNDSGYICWARSHAWSGVSPSRTFTELPSGRGTYCAMVYLNCVGR